MDKPLSKQSAAPPFVFSEGAQWIRADFHLHTRADREFKFASDDSFYHSHYVDALAKASIRLGVITNHNKFDFDEFKALRKTAQKKELRCYPAWNCRSTMGPMAFIPWLSFPTTG